MPQSVTVENVFYTVHSYCFQGPEGFLASFSYMWIQIPSSQEMPSL